MRKKIILINIICLILIILLSSSFTVIANETNRIPSAPNYTTDGNWKTVVHLTEGNMKDHLTERGYTLVSEDKGFEFDDNSITESQVLNRIYGYLEGLSYGFNRDRNDMYINKWFNGQNGTDAVDFESLKKQYAGFGSINVNCVIQWTDLNTMNDSIDNVMNKKIYMARIHMTYDGDFGRAGRKDVDIVIYTNEAIDSAYTQTVKKEYDKIKQENDMIENAYKTKPGQNASAQEIWAYFTSIEHRPQTEIDKIYDELKSDKTLIKTWLGTVAPERDPKYEPIKTILENLWSGETISEQAKENLQNQIAFIKKLAYGNALNDHRNQNVTFNDVLTDIGTYKPGDLDKTSSNKIESVTSKILTIITNIGVAVSVIILASLGIKYMLGSVEEKAEYKQSLIPYVVGAFILFGITSFIKILMSFGNMIAGI